VVIQGRKVGCAWENCQRYDNNLVRVLEIADTLKREVCDLSHKLRRSMMDPTDSSSNNDYESSSLDTASSFSDTTNTNSLFSD
jgi:hypothetical protein